MKQFRPFSNNPEPYFALLLFFQIKLLVRSGNADFSGCEGETMQKSCPVPKRDVFVLSLHPIRVPCSELLRGRTGQSITREET